MKKKLVLLLILVGTSTLAGCKNNKNISTSSFTPISMSKEECVVFIKSLDTSLDRKVKSRVLDDTMQYKVNQACYKNHEEEFYQVNNRYPIEDDALFETTMIDQVYENAVLETKTIGYETSYLDNSQKTKKTDRVRQIYPKDDYVYWVNKDNIDDKESFGSISHTKLDMEIAGYDNLVDYTMNDAIEPLGLNGYVIDYYSGYSELYPNQVVMSGTKYEDNSVHIEGYIYTMSQLNYLPVPWPNDEMFPIFDVEVIVDITYSMDFNSEGYCVDFNADEHWSMPYSPYDGTSFEDVLDLYQTVIHYHDIKTDSLGDFQGTYYDYGNLD